MKKYWFFSLAMALILLVAFSGCGGGSSSPDPGVTPTPGPVPPITVYSGGGVNSGGSSDYSACYWINDVMRPLPTTGVQSQESFVVSIFVADGHVYAGGYYRDSSDKRRACYWDNENFIPLGNAGYSSEVTAITVSDGHIYAAGFNCYKDYGYSTACYWKDGNSEQVDVDLAHASSRASSIVVVNNKVYTSGFYDDFNSCFWNDTACIPLTPPTGSSGRAMTESFLATDGNKLYVGGGYYSNDDPVACYWTYDINDTTGASGNCVTLGQAGNESSIKSIAVANGHVYAGGSILASGASNSKACYWKDDNRTPAAIFDSNAGAFMARVWKLLILQDHVLSIGTYDVTGSPTTRCYWWDINPTPVIIGYLGRDVQCYYATSP